MDLINSYSRFHSQYLKDLTWVSRSIRQLLEVGAALYALKCFTERPTSPPSGQVKVAQSGPTLRPQPPNSPWDSSSQNTRVCSLSFLQGIFPTKGPNPGLPYCRWTLYQLSHKGSPRILEWVAYPFSSRSSQPRNWTGISCTDGQGGPACCGSWGLEESGTTERLNWTELLRCRRILCQREALITLTDWLTRWSKGHTSHRPLVSRGLHLLCGEWAVAFSTLQRGSQTPQESSGLGNVQPSMWWPAGVL